MPEPSPAGGLLSDLGSFAVLDRLVDGPVGRIGLRAARPVPDERPAADTDEPPAAVVPLRRDARPRSRGGRRGAAAGG